MNLPGSPGFPAHSFAPRESAPGEGMVGISLRQPPANLAAEQALLGALLANNRAHEQMAEFLRPEHFYDPLHGRLYAAICRRIEAGQIADVVTLRPEFEKDPAIAEAGGPGYLAQLLGAMVGLINAVQYARLVHDAWHRRELIAQAEALAAAAFEPAKGQTGAALQEAHEAALLRLAETANGGGARPGPEVARDVVNNMFAAIARKGGLAGLASGYAGLDRMLGGFMPGQFIVLGGRPGMGKTAMAGGIAARCAALGARVYFWGGEMDDSQVMARLVAAAAGLPLAAVLRGALAEGGTLRPLTNDDEETHSAVEAAREVGALPIHWDDQPALTLSALRSRLRRHKRKHGLDLVVVDYLGLLRGSEDARKFGRLAEMSELSRGLKALARELRVPVLCAAQLNRALEGRDNKRPILADLRDTGEIEQDTDVVMFIHREHYYLEKARPVKKPGQDEEKYNAILADWRQQLDASEFTGELIVCKQRNGETGTVPLRWSPRMTWYFDANEPEGAGALPPGKGD